METVKESKLKLQSTFSDSESIHLKSFTDTGMLFKPTSKKASVAIIVVVITEVHAIICDPLTPIFLPKKPQDIEPSKGNIIIIKYII
jgi:hypothetical protein